jgi:hypothetical protein
MMMEKRRGMAARAKVNGSLIKSFRSPMDSTPPFSLVSPSPSVKDSSSPFKSLGAGIFCLLQNSTIYGYINKEDELRGDEVNE